MFGVFDEGVEDPPNPVAVFGVKKKKVGAVPVIEREDEDIHFLLLERMRDLSDEFIR
jgi:hypothetical protein